MPVQYRFEFTSSACANKSSVLVECQCRVLSSGREQLDQRQSKCSAVVSPGPERAFDNLKRDFRVSARSAGASHGPRKPFCVHNRGRGCQPFGGSRAKHSRLTGLLLLGRPPQSGASEIVNSLPAYAFGCGLFIYPGFGDESRGCTWRWASRRRKPHPRRARRPFIRLNVTLVGSNAPWRTAHGGISGWRGDKKLLALGIKCKFGPSTFCKTPEFSFKFALPQNLAFKVHPSLPETSLNNEFVFYNLRAP